MCKCVFIFPLFFYHNWFLEKSTTFCFAVSRLSHFAWPHFLCYFFSEGISRAINRRRSNLRCRYKDLKSYFSPIIACKMLFWKKGGLSLGDSHLMVIYIRYVKERWDTIQKLYNLLWSLTITVLFYILLIFQTTELWIIKLKISLISIQRFIKSFIK